MKLSEQQALKLLQVLHDTLTMKNVDVWEKMHFNFRLLLDEREELYYEIIEQQDSTTRDIGRERKTPKDESSLIIGGSAHHDHPVVSPDVHGFKRLMSF